MIDSADLTWHRPKRFWHRVEYTLTADVYIASHKVPQGFRTDGATIPFFLRWAFSPMGPWAPAAWLHDYLLSKDAYTREMAAKVFYRAMGELGIPQPIRKGFYLGVRAWDRVKDWRR